MLTRLRDAVVLRSLLLKGQAACSGEHGNNVNTTLSLILMTCDVVRGRRSSVLILVKSVPADDYGINYY